MKVSMALINNLDWCISDNCLLFVLLTSSYYMCAFSRHQRPGSLDLLFMKKRSNRLGTLAQNSCENIWMTKPTFKSDSRTNNPPTLPRAQVNLRVLNEWTAMGHGQSQKRGSSGKLGEDVGDKRGWRAPGEGYRLKGSSLRADIKPRTYKLSDYVEIRFNQSQSTQENRCFQRTMWVTFSCQWKPWFVVCTFKHKHF
jgi:hypothetical protein